jgi:hypothetical protein
MLPVELWVVVFSQRNQLDSSAASPKFVCACSMAMRSSFVAYEYADCNCKLKLHKPKLESVPALNGNGNCIEDKGGACAVSLFLAYSGIATFSFVSAI